jgi:O-antigen/teichoic acid export membrane protein
MHLEKALAILKLPRTKRFFIYGIGQAVNLVSPLLVIPYIVLQTGEQGLGKIGVGMSFAFILIVLVDYSSYLSGVKQVAVSRDNPQVLKSLLAQVYFAKLLLLLAVCACVYAASYFVPYIVAERQLFLLSLMIVIGQFLNPSWFFQGVEDFGWISAINVVSKAIYVIGVWLTLSSAQQYIYVNFWFGLGLALPSAVAVIYLWIKHSVLIGDFKLRGALQLIRSDFALCFSQFFFALRQYSPIIIIDLLSGGFLAGQYKILEQIVMLFRTYFQMVFKFSLGSVAYELNQNFQKGLNYWKKINLANLGAVAVMLLAVYVFSYPIFDFFKVKPEFWQSYQQILQVAVFLPLVIGLTLAQEQLMLSTDKNKEYIRITIMITFVSTFVVAVAAWAGDLRWVFGSLVLTEIFLASCYHYYLKPVYKNIFSHDRQSAEQEKRAR